jgi:putative intracellular protease/amidase
MGFPEVSNVKAPRGFRFPPWSLSSCLSLDGLKHPFQKEKKMRKISIFVTVMLFLMAGVVSFTAEVYGQSARKVLMVPREGYSADLDLMLKMEVGVMTILLKGAGFQVDVATTSGQSILGQTEKIEKVMRLSEIKLDDYVGIIMPCMAVGWYPGPPVGSEAIAIVKKAVSDGKPVAAGANASILLAEAGLLKEKKYAFFRDPLKTDANWNRTDLRYEGGIYSGDGVVQDGKIITSGVCPVLERGSGKQNGTVKLTQTFIAAIGPK